MLDADAITALLIDHFIARAEHTLAAAVNEGSLSAEVHRTLDAIVAEMYDRRRVHLEAMMGSPFNSARADG